MRKGGYRLLVCIVILAMAAWAEAANIYWDGNGHNPPNGDWSDRFNWTGDSLPDDEYVNFDHPDTYTVTVDMDPYIPALGVEDGDVTFVSDGPARREITTWAVNWWSLVGTGGTMTLDNVYFNATRFDYLQGEVNVVNGGRLRTSYSETTVPGWLAFRSSSSGELKDLSVSGNLSVEEGSSLLSGIHGDTAAIDDPAIGQAVVTGAGSVWEHQNRLDVGLDDKGEMYVWNGGSLQTGGTDLGRNAGSEGSGELSGAGSSWSCTGSLHVGYDGKGTLAVSNGGTLTSAAGYIGYNSNDDNTVVVGGGNTATWENTGTILDVGSSGRGTLTVKDGGLLKTNSVCIGFGALSQGAVTIGDSGAPATWTDLNQVAVAGNLSTAGGDGTLMINNNSTATIASVLRIWNPGVVWVEGGATLKAGYLDRVGGTFVTAAQSTVMLNGMSMASWSNPTFQGDFAIGTIHEGAGVTGTINVGAGQSITVVGDMDVGYDGSGTLNLSGGGDASCATAYLGRQTGSQGTVTVMNEGSALQMSGDLVVGAAGAGNLSLSAGGDVHNTHATVGRDVSVTGMVDISGNGSRWSMPSGGLQLGYYGTGILNIIGGGGLETAWANLGRKTGAIGVATIEGAGSFWTATGTFHVGYEGTGQVFVRDHGALNTTDGNIGRHQGTVGVEQNGTWTDSGSLYVGGSNSGPGTYGYMTIKTGGTVDVGQTVKIWGPGTVDLQDGTLIADTLEDAGGTFQMTAGGTLRVNTLTNFGTTPSFAGSLQLGHSGGTCSYLIGGDQNLTVGGGLTVGYDSAAAMSNSDGTLYSQSAYLGQQADGEGTMTVAGAAAGWSNPGAVEVGYYGKGHVTLSGGATVNTGAVNVGRHAGSNASLTVEGGSTWTATAPLTVGHAGDGELTVQTGGTVCSAGGDVGNSSTGYGAVTIDGDGASWSAAGLQLGHAGVGHLLVTGGGVLSTAWANLGRSVDAIGIAVVESGSTWTASEAVHVGHTGSGTLVVRSGAELSTAGVYVARTAGSAGELTIEDAGSTWTSSGSAQVGGDGVVSGGSGILNIRAGASVDIADTLKIWDASTVTFDGDTLDVVLLDVSEPGAIFCWTDGRLQVDTVRGDLFNNGGTLAPGHSVGTTTVAGDYVQHTTGTLMMELAAADLADLLAVDGTATLGGELAITDLYGASSSDTWTILTATGGISGSFDTITTGYEVSLANGDT